MIDNIEYTLIRSSRKSCSIQIKADGTITVRAPRLMPKANIDRFINEKMDWIERNRNRILSRQNELNAVRHLNNDEIIALTRSAKQVIPQRVEYFAGLMNVQYNKIFIRHQKTRWGSCSAKKNLNFNCLMMLTPSEIIDYIIVHELCHLKQMNHSKNFWSEVERYLPEYKKSYDWLKKNGAAIIAQIK